MHISFGFLEADRITKNFRISHSILIKKFSTTRELQSALAREIPYASSKISHCYGNHSPPEILHHQHFINRDIRKMSLIKI